MSKSENQSFLGRILRTDAEEGADPGRGAIPSSKDKPKTMLSTLSPAHYAAEAGANGRDRLGSTSYASWEVFHSTL